MNLRVDLILPSEQRSGSPVSPKSLLRMASVVGPALVVLLVFMGIIGMLKLKSEEKMLQSKWELTEPLREDADKRLAALQRSIRIHRELEGWKKARITWHEHVGGIMRVTPANIQLEALRVSQTLQLENKRIPSRVFALTLKGKALGAQAEASVQNLERQLVRAAPFAGLVAQVAVPTFRADTSKEANRDDRIFGITCAYGAVKFE